MDLNIYNKNVPDICTNIWKLEELCLTVFGNAERFSYSGNLTISKQILLDPKLFLLGLFPEKQNYSRSEQAFIDLGLIYAKNVLAFC